MFVNLWLFKPSLTAWKNGVVVCFLVSCLTMASSVTAESMPPEFFLAQEECESSVEISMEMQTERVFFAKKYGDPVTVKNPQDFPDNTMLIAQLGIDFVEIRDGVLYNSNYNQCMKDLGYPSACGSEGFYAPSVGDDAVKACAYNASVETAFSKSYGEIVKIYKDGY